MKKANILITQCLQNDFVKLIEKYDPLPNQLHIGYAEALRLLGENPSEGPLNTLMEWAYMQSDDNLQIIHIRDWHALVDKQQHNHFKQFGSHCIQNSNGAEFVFQPYIKDTKNQIIINSNNLNDFIDTDLENILKKYNSSGVRIGITGVWTEAKIFFLCYELKTRFPEIDIAICSALTASSSRANHFIALQQIQNLLDVQVFSSIGSFTQFLAGTSPEIKHRLHPRIDENILNIEHGYSLSEIDKRVLLYLFRQSKEVHLKCLDGGFSGNVVVKAKSVDNYGHTQVPTVIKIGQADLISKERVAFEKIQEVMGNCAPNIIDFVEVEDRGGIKYRYASMLDGNVRTFQQFYSETDDLYKINLHLETVFEKQLGKLYEAKDFENIDLLKYYDFSSKYAESVSKNLQKILVESRNFLFINEINQDEIDNLINFYKNDVDKFIGSLPSLHYKSFIHGDLNGRNILIDAQNNIWIIDFFHTHYGHILKDLVKFENDIKFIFTSINSESDWKDGIKLIDLIHQIDDLWYFPQIETNEVFQGKQFNKAFKTIEKLRTFYKKLIDTDRDPYQYYVASLRYSMHNLSFEESSPLQKALALYSSVKTVDKIIKHHINNSKIRLDVINCTFNTSAKLYITILPGRRDRNRELIADMLEIKGKNISSIVCLIMPDEFIEYGVKDLKAQYEQSGFKTFYLPIRDQGVPIKSDLMELISWIYDRISSGENVLIHCVGGLGRSGLVAAAFLVLKFNYSPYEAIEIIRKSRSIRAIENKMQEGYIYSLVD